MYVIDTAKVYLLVKVEASLARDPEDEGTYELDPDELASKIVDVSTDLETEMTNVFESWTELEDVDVSILQGYPGVTMLRRKPSRFEGRAVL